MAAKIDHSNCTHERTPKDRAACRAARATGTSPAPVSETRVAEVPETITGADRAARLQDMMRPLVSRWT